MYVILVCTSDSQFFVENLQTLEENCAAICICAPFGFPKVIKVILYADISKNSSRGNKLFNPNNLFTIPDHIYYMWKHWTKFTLFRNSYRLLFIQTRKWYRNLNTPKETAYFLIKINTSAPSLGKYKPSFCLTGVVSHIK